MSIKYVVVIHIINMEALIMATQKHIRVLRPKNARAKIAGTTAAKLTKLLIKVPYCGETIIFS